jgi:serine protease DegQ
MRSMLGARRPWLIGLALVVAVLGGCTNEGSPNGQAATTPAPAVPSGLAAQGPSGAIPRLVEQVRPSVVTIISGQGEGSGVVWDKDGTVVTNEHVVRDGGGSVEVAFADGRRAPGRVLATDPVTDLAVVRADRKELPPARFAKRAAVVGELALAIGNPLGFENSVTAGIISGLHRSIPGSAPQQALVDLVQTDAAISPGNSGGALVAADGTVLGVNEAYIPPERGAVSLGFAIPAPTVTSVVEQLLKTGRARHAFAGLQPATMTPDIAQQFGIDRDSGAIVVQVADGAPAARAGVEPGDVIIRAGDTEVRTAEDFLAALRSRAPGDKLPLTLIHDGQERTVELTLADRPS